MSKEKIKVAVQMDKLKNINKDTDRTLALIQEAIKRKFSVFIYNVDNLYFENNELKAIANRVLSLNIQKEKFLTLDTTHVINLKSFEFVLIRQDPPFNLEYISTTFILETIKNKVKIINNPTSIRNISEKLYSIRYQRFMPNTIFTQNIHEIKNFFKKK